MKRIHVTDQYFIDIEDLNYTLKRRVEGKNKKGEPIVTERVVGYYGKLTHALDALANQMLADGIDGDMSVREAADMFRSIINRFVEGSGDLSANTE